MSDLITMKIENLGDWHGMTLSQVRRAILAADPDIGEDIKCLDQAQRRLEASR